MPMTGSPWWRPALLLLVIAALAAGPAAVGVRGGGAPETVRVALTPLQAWAPLWIAEQEGFFDRQGIRIEWVPFAGGAENIAVLAQGQLDVGAGGISAAFFNAVARGERLRIVADQGHIEPDSGAPALVVRRELAGGAVRGVADLKGRKVGVNVTGALAHYIVAKALARAGVRVQDVELVRMPFPAILAALQSDAIDAGVLSEPLISQATETGVGTVLATAGQVIPGEAVAFIYYGANLIEQDPGLGRRFMVAYLMGLRQYQQGAASRRNVEIVAAAMRADPALIRKMEWYAMYRDGRVAINGLRRFQDWLYELEFINVRLPVSNLVDTRFIEHANAAVGP